MIAYNRRSLDNLAIQYEAMEAFEKKMLTPEEYSRIRIAYPFHFYIPNAFIRLGIFVLTVIAAACALGLFLLMGLGSGDRSIGTMLIVLGVISYGLLELFIHAHKVYQAGVDDALLWIASALVVTGINFTTDHLSPPLESFIILVLAVAGTLRYADRLMALAAYGALLSFIFYRLAEWGVVARAILPFVVLALSAGGYFLFTRLAAKESLRHYHPCILLLRVATLVTFYLAGNYYIIREVNASLSGGQGPVALGWLWWLLTAAVPVFYIVKGLQKKDPLFLWTGLGLVAATIFTVRYYYHVLPAEWAMILGGTVLIAGAYGAIRYLKTPKYGFTAELSDDPHLLADLHVEGIILAESFTAVAAQPADPGVSFGGGTTGGGGAGGQY